MRIGLIGAGSMATALARGWGEPVVCSDNGSGRGRALAEETGGEFVNTNEEVARRADLVILCHKPPQMEAVAEQIAPHAQAVVSVLARRSVAELQAAYGEVPVVRVEPNTPVEVRRGTIAMAPEGGTPELREQVAELFGRVGTVVEIPEHLMTVAGGCAGVGPAYWSLLAEAWIDAAVRHGIPAPTAAQLVIGTMAGSAALLEARGHDTLAVRRGVTSPGGTTARGLAALERGGVRAALAQALDEVVEYR